MKIKKIIAGGLSILLAVGAISLAPGNGMVTYAATPPNIASQGAALYNANTGEFLYEKFGNIIPNLFAFCMKKMGISSFSRHQSQRL